MFALLDMVLSRVLHRRACAGTACGPAQQHPVPERGLGRDQSADSPRMNPVAQLLSPEDILLDLDVSTKKRVFEEVGRLLERRHGVVQTQVVESLSAREKLGSTGLGQGVALPHARIKHLRQAVAAFVRLKLPIPFEAPDGKPVSEMLVLLVPEHATDQHLQLLAEVAQMFCDRGFREQLRTGVDPGGICHLFADWTPS
jgi:PTS system nitrogen regulatory IIA component